jgi:hypothetical protein
MTTLAHSSGQWISGEMPIVLSKTDPQSIGSALTYYRRYTLSAMIGIAPEDDDGENAQESFRKLSTDQIQTLRKLFEDYPEYAAKVKDKLKLKGPEDVPPDYYQRIINGAKKL